MLTTCFVLHGIRASQSTFTELSSQNEVLILVLYFGN